MDVCWEQKEARHEDKNAQLIELCDMVRKSTMTWSMTGANVKIYIAILKMRFSRR